MKPLSSKSVVSEPTVSWPARVGHEAICAVVTGIFCLFELLVLITEWRAKKGAPRRDLSSETSPAAKPVLGTSRVRLAGK